MKLKRFHICTGQDVFVFVSKSCASFAESQDVLITCNKKKVAAQLATADFLKKGEAALSENTFQYLGAKEGDDITITHIDQAKSLPFVHEKIQGKKLSKIKIDRIVQDIVSRHLTHAQVASFLTACTRDPFDDQETYFLTKAMVDVGDVLAWPCKTAVDKHCAGGIPGNRTTPIVVSIVASCGLIIPKTSSRSITSPAGTADTMEVLTKVDLDVNQMKYVLEKEGGCFIWGGSVSLSPADKIILHVEKELGIDTRPQLVASILSKKIAAGAKHILIDLPVGKTAKIKTMHDAQNIKDELDFMAKKFDLDVKVVLTKGDQPIGRGIGPCLEARDVLSVLRCEKNAPQDLREKAIFLADQILAFAGKSGAAQVLDSGAAYDKFKAICKAQGGFYDDIAQAPIQHGITSDTDGAIMSINNIKLAHVAKLAGAPAIKTSGVDLHVRLELCVKKGDPLFTIHTDSQEQLKYILCNASQGIFDIF